MDKIIFTEEFCRPEYLYPFTLTRQIQDIRIGILTIREKWETILGLPSFDRKENDYKDLDRSVTLGEAVEDGSSCLLIHGNVLPAPALVKATRKLRNGEFISLDGKDGIIFRFSQAELADEHNIRVSKAVTVREQVDEIQYPWHIFQMNDRALRQDFELLTKKRRSQPLPKSNAVSGRGHIFIEKGARIGHSIINATTGPVYIGRGAEILDGCLIRGPFAMLEGAVLKMGAKVYGATTLGPYCVAGGEIKNSVLFGYSNKAHDGYLGDSVVGEWCNLGAGTTNSNLKNTAGDIGVWTPGGVMNAGNKCGMFMGDYSRTAINTSVNTGTIIGACAHVFGAGLTPKYIPSFSWGSEGVKRYEKDKVLTDLAAWKKLKGEEITANERQIINYIFEKF